MAKTLNERVIEAKMLAQLGKVIKTRGRRVTLVTVPGSNATFNDVLINRHPDGVITTECRKVVPGGNYVACKGNLAGVCRHSIAAIMMANEAVGYKPYFRRELKSAKILANYEREVAFEIDGEPVIFTIGSHQSSNVKPLYMVVVDVTATELCKGN